MGLTHKLTPDGRVIITDTRFDPLFGGGPPPADAINTDPPAVLDGTGILQGLTDSSCLVRPLSQFNNSGASDDAGPINDALGFADVVRLGPWTYNLASAGVVLRPGQFLVCTRATVLSYTGSGAAVSMTQTAYQTDGSKIGGGILGYPTIDGTGAGAGAAGVHAGDVLQMRWEAFVQNFSGTGSIGVHFDNRNWWAEQLRARLYVLNCAQHVVFDCSGATTSTGSYARCDIQIYLDQTAGGQDGVVLQNGAVLYDGSLGIYGNFVGSSAAVTSAVLRITGSTPAGHTANDSQINRCRVEIGVECAGGYSFTPQTIVFGTAAGNTLQNCHGLIDFGSGAGTFSASNNNGNFSYLGPVIGDLALIEAGNTGTWKSITTGFPAGWTGHVGYKKLYDTDLVAVSWSLTIASGTVVATTTQLATIPAGYYYPSDTKRFAGDVTGGGLSPAHQYAPLSLNTVGALYYNGPGFTASGSAYVYGQAIFSNSF